MTAIKTVGNQTFMSSSINEISVNLAHVVKVYKTDYCYSENEDEEAIEGVCIGILLTDNSTVYFSAYPEGWREGKHCSYKVYNDPTLVREVWDTFF